MCIVLIPIIIIVIRTAVMMMMMMMMGLNVNKEYYHRDVSFWLFRNSAGMCLMRSIVAEKW